MVDNSILMPAALDREVSSPDRDAFGHRHLARALQSLIESDQYAPPFSIGLLGGWGTGKTTIKELYIRDLVDDARKNAAGYKRSERIHCITFNAWRFGGKEQDIKRALLRHVFLELGGDDQSLQDRLFRQITESREEPKGWVEYQKDLLRAWAMPLPAFVFSLLLLVGLLYLAFKILPVTDDLSRSIVVLALTGAYAYLMKQLKSPPVSAYHPVTRIALPIATAEQYEDLLLAQIHEFKSGKSGVVGGKSGKACERLVVFVDDLDRLSAEEMVLGLDAVRTFMEIPESRLPKGLGLVFVISCDETKVAHALAKGRGHGDLPGTVFSQSDARRYLDRIFQFRLEIPPFPRHDMRQYALKKLKELPGIEADLHARGVPVDHVVDRMIHVGVQDPRNALQIVNAFAQAWWLAKKRETEELGTDRPGGLHEGAVTTHPISLGALSAMKVNFPDCYGDLQGDPALLHRLTDVLVRRKPIEEQPLLTQQLLAERYLVKMQDDPTAPPEVRAEHRPLRQFLASLVGLRWPDSLQSLLLLSEDPVTRRYGAKATTIYAAFVSGDTQGVLEALGRHADGAALKPDEARLLHQMTEDIRLESAPRRINASRVVADLVERLPAGVAQMLLGSLCRELGDSPDLRSQLGIEKIGKVLAGAHGDDRHAVASRLIEDVLTLQEDVRFHLETMEPPNLEEAVAFARSTVSLVLPIRRNHGLDAGADAQLLAWLADRTVTIAGKHHQLAFQELEQWMADHEDHLLLALSERYTTLLAAELEADEEPAFEISEAIRRAGKVFAHLWSAGEDTRPTLWEHLSRYVAVESPSASRTAWEMMADHVTSPDAAQISAFLIAFIERLTQHTKDETADFDFGKATSVLLTIVRTRRADIDAATRDAIADLAVLWSQEDESASLACDLLKEISSDAEQTQEVLDNWAQRLLTDLPVDCVRLFASLFPTLTSATQSNAMAKLQPIVGTDSIDQPTAARYEAFVESVPDQAWDAKPLKAHLDSVLPQIAARHNNPNGYLERVLPPVATVVDHASPAILGQALHTLFANAKGQPKHYALLHSHMVGHWPKPSSDLTNYDPAQIFRDGQDFAINQPQFSSAGLLESLRDMLARDIVPSSHRAGLIEAACATWTVAPQHAIETFRAGFDDLSSEQVAKLLLPIDWTQANQQSLLTQAWTTAVIGRSDEELLQATNLILEQCLRGPEDEPDRGLRLWFDALGKERTQILGGSMCQTTLNDTHRKRLWQQAARSPQDLGATFFLEVIPKLAVLPAIDDTAECIFGDFDRVFGVLGSTDNRAELSQQLMKAFPGAATNTIKAHIAEWSKKLSGEAALSELTPEVITVDDLSILDSRFPGARALKKLRKNLSDKDVGQNS